MCQLSISQLCAFLHRIHITTENAISQIDLLRLEQRINPILGECISLVPLWVAAMFYFSHQQICRFIAALPNATQCAQCVATDCIYARCSICTRITMNARALGETSRAYILWASFQETYEYEYVRLQRNRKYARWAVCGWCISSANFFEWMNKTQREDVNSLIREEMQ